MPLETDAGVSECNGAVDGVPRNGDVFSFPMSYSQERIWFLEQLSPGGTSFNLMTVSALDAAADEVVLERSLNEIVRRHESLRTTFACVDGEPRQLVVEHAWISLVVIDLTALPPDAALDRAEMLAVQEAQRPFDLGRLPLLRATLVKVTEDRQQLFVAMHHIVSDGWSMGVFWRELACIWRALSAGKQLPSLPELEIQYPDYAVWQRDWLQGETLARELEYWRQTLEGAPPTLDLPSDRPRPTVSSRRGETFTVSLDAELVGAVRRACLSHNATAFLVLLAGFAALLARYTGEDDIVIGSYVAGRNRSETENLIGFFLNTIVLRCDLSGDPTFAELLARVRRIALDAYSHQDVPFAKIVEAIHPSRDLSRNPIFQVVFQALNVPTLDRRSTDPTPPQPDRGASEFDLSCMVIEDDERIDIKVEFSTDLFDATTIRRYFEHFVLLLGDALSNYLTPISQLALISAAERQLLSRWSVSTFPVSDGRSLMELFDNQVEATPESVAFVYDDETLTYRDLRDRADSLTRRLHQDGVNSGDVVGVHLTRTLELPVALLAVLRAGAVYLPLEPTGPMERLRYIIADAQPAVIITHSSAATSCPLDDVTLIDVGAPRSTAATANGAFASAVAAPAGASKPEAQNDRALPDDVMYIVYTSGSSGQPKGVAVPHRVVLNRMAWMWREYPFREGEVCAQRTPANFVDSIWELLGPLLQGVSTVIVPDAVVRDPDALVLFLGRAGVTRLWIVPSLLSQLLPRNDLADSLPRLTFWVSSGEALSSDLLASFEQAMPHATLFNLYGTSEVWDATWWDPSGHSAPLWRVPIGRPIDNVEVQVVDRNLRPVPIGVPGDLLVGGAGLARGYHRRADLTTERFIRQRRLAGGECTMYRTGDFVRYLADGNLEYLGRIDQQAKIRGCRVELAEVEAMLVSHPDVAQAVVVVDGEPQAPSLRAYVVPITPERRLHEADLRRHLRRHAPDFMVPGEFWGIERLPLTYNGKVDRRALETLSAVRLPVSDTVVTPRHGFENVIASVWRDVLGVAEIGIDSNFFDVGGHSLLLTAVHSRLRSLLDIELSVTDLFGYPTIRSLAAYCRARRENEQVTRNGAQGRYKGPAPT